MAGTNKYTSGYLERRRKLMGAGLSGKSDSKANAGNGEMPKGTRASEGSIQTDGTQRTATTDGSGYTSGYLARRRELLPGMTGQKTIRLPSFTESRNDILHRVYSANAGRYQEEQEEYGDRGFLPRLLDTISGGAKQSIGNTANLMVSAYEAGQGGRTNQNRQNLRDAEWALARAKRDYDLELEAMGGDENARPLASYKSVLDDSLRDVKAYADVLGTGAYETAVEEAYRAAEQLAAADDLDALYQSLGQFEVSPGTGVQERATRASYELADQIQQSGAKDVGRAKEGLGTFGQVLVDAGASMTQVAGDALTGAATGLPGMVPFVTRALGGGMQQARQDGADLGGQLLYLAMCAPILSKAIR